MTGTSLRFTCLWDWVLGSVSLSIASLSDVAASQVPSVAAAALFFTVLGVHGWLQMVITVMARCRWFEEDLGSSSGMLLTLTVTFLFHFRLAVTEQYCLFTPTFFERVETYHYERHVRAMVRGF